MTAYPHFIRFAAIVALAITALAGRATISRSVHAANGPRLFAASIDTMKESMDTDTWQLSNAQIAESVNLAATLNPTYITVDTFWDYPSYMQRWVNAVRATGRHVWFRGHPNQWENNNGAAGIMTPSAYESAERAFILANRGLYRSGDILDPCPEPENGKYWISAYGSQWTWHAPNAATRAYNAFIRDTTTVADNALHQLGMYGVITTVRSTNSFFATDPNSLEAATVSMMGRITVDSYPDQSTTDPTTATNLRMSELDSIYAIWHVPVVVGEMGYSNKINVDDMTQDRVLKAEFAAMATRSYVVGVNYWVGAGTYQSGGYTHIFNGDVGTWSARPAAAELSAFYGDYGSLLPVSGPTPALTATFSPLPSSTALVAASRTATTVTALKSTPTSSPVPTLIVPVAQTSTPLPIATRAISATATAVPRSSVTLHAGGPMLAGPALTSHMSGSLGTATFDSVSVR
jgi:hypothetical protein